MILLIVDSKQESRASSARILQQAGYQIAETGEAGEALYLCRERKSPLVIVAARHLEDAAVCRQIKNDESLRGTFVLKILPESSEPLDYAADSSADACLAEPYHPQNLVAFVQTLLKFRQSENDLRNRAENLLRESAARLRLATEAAQIGTWQWDLRTNKIFWSAIHKQFWGYEGGDGEIDYDDWRRLLDQEDLQMAENEIAIALRDDSIYDIEYRIYPAGEEKARWIRSVGQAVYNASGEAVQMLGISTDITRRREHEEEILRLNRELEARVAEAELANRSKDEFLAVLSHELRTPLNSMFGWVRMLNSGQLDAERTKRALEVIERNIIAQTKLIEDILDVSRIISGKIRLENRTIDLSSLVASVVETTRPIAEAKNVIIEIGSAPESCSVECDAERLQQVVSNLLSNAVKFTPSEGRVRIDIHCQNNIAELSVTDTGIGIEPKFLPFVFDRFKQADSSSKRKHGGLGLGLAIVKHLVELHGGAVEAHSGGENQGATFIIRLPMRRQETKPVLTATDLVENNSGNKLDNIRILLVDDDRDALEMLRTMLSAQGALVTTADSATLALSLMEQNAFDLLISDIGMPGTDGIEFIGKARQSKKTRVRGLPAIALTAYAGADDRQRILAAGFQQYLPKPISFIELLAAISSLIQAKPES